MTTPTCELVSDLHVIIVRICLRSGLGVQLKYIEESDIANEKVRIRTAVERANDSEFNLEPDADDLGVLKDKVGTPKERHVSHRYMPGSDHSMNVMIHVQLAYSHLNLGNGWSN